MLILEYLAGEPQGIRVSDLGKRLNLNRALPFRILSDLMALGYVTQDPISERYHATFMLGSLGLRQIGSSGVQDWAQDELNALALTTRELVRLAVASEGHLHFVCKAQGANSALMIDSNAGSDAALHATASGKAWLSTFDNLTIERLMGHRGLTTYTDSTPATLSKLLRDLDEVRRLGYCLIHEEMEPGVSAIAAPIVPPECADGPAVATISIAGPTSRVHDTLSGFAPELLATSRRLAERWRVHDHLERQGARVTAAGMNFTRTFGTP